MHDKYPFPLDKGNEGSGDETWKGKEVCDTDSFAYLSLFYKWWAENVRESLTD